MAFKYKLHVCEKILAELKKTCSVNVEPSIFASLLTTVSSDDGRSLNYMLTEKSIKNIINDYDKEHKNCVLRTNLDSVLLNVNECTNTRSETSFLFEMDKKHLVKEILGDHNYYDNLINPKLSPRNEKVVVDYSSPNIAKPFHVGNFRSTIIGNFIANLYEHFHYQVVRITYLGDWGTQFGLLQVGLDDMKISDEDLKENPIELLYKAYVHANKIAESDTNTSLEARNAFTQLEQGNDLNSIKRWESIRQYTVDELAKTYKRLGIVFDEYKWESTYNAEVLKPVLETMHAKGLVKIVDGKQVVDLPSGRQVTVLKSDGSSLYLTRDIAAALDRYSQHHFSCMLYVVDSSQTDHFVALKHILSALGWDWARNVEHVKFGRIKGMSTRKGQVVFIRDILDEAKLRMQEKQAQSPTTKDGVTEETADALGITAVIVNDLKQRRYRDYNFDWNSALQADGDSGIKLQYTHCRLSNLEKNCGHFLPDHCESELIHEPEAILLLEQIARFDEVVHRAFKDLEACIIVNYLFRLCNATSRALKVLNVKHQPRDIAAQRLLLFNRARAVLCRAMKILGLKPLQSM